MKTMEELRSQLLELHRHFVLRSNVEEQSAIETVMRFLGMEIPSEEYWFEQEEKQ